MKILRSLIVLLTAGMLLTGCRHAGDLMPEEHPGPWTPTEVETMLSGDDPIEGFNRSMFACTDFLMCYLADPIGRIYTTIIPKPVITHLDQFCTNLEYPAHLLSCLLQAEWQGALDDTLRFLINTTIGIGGFFDAADYWWQIPPSGSGFGQTFAVWGIRPGESFVLPVVPATNTRDMAGMLFDSAFDIKTYIPYMGYATVLNRITMAQQQYDSVTKDSLDPYKNYRLMTSVYRQLQIQLHFYHKRKGNVPTEETALSLDPVQDGKHDTLAGRHLHMPEYQAQDAVTDTIRSILYRPDKRDDFWYMPLSLFNSDFANAGSRRKLRLLEDRPRMYYKFWNIPEKEDEEGNVIVEKEKLAVLIPGIGGTCTADNITAFAEKFHNAGYKVITLDNTFHWRFISADSPCRLPGYLPDDARRVRDVICAAIQDLKDDEKLKDPEIVISGYSLGGILTLKLAEMEEKDPKIGNTVRFVAVNPPVSLFYAMQQIDKLNTVSAGWTKSEVRDRMVKTAGKLLALRAGFFPRMNKESAAFTVGLALKASMRDLLFAAHREQPLKDIPEASWGSRHEAYAAIDKLTMNDYAFKYLVPSWEGKTPEEVIQAGSLHSMENTLRNSKKIRILHTWNDFLVNDRDRLWLGKIMGDRITWFTEGGHLGQFYHPGFSEELIRLATEE